MHHLWAIIKDMSKEISDLRSSAYASISSSSKAIGYADFDFGDRKTFVTMDFLNASISTSNTINIYPEGREEEFLMDNITSSVIINSGSGFSITLYSPRGSIGIYKVKYTIQ